MVGGFALLILLQGETLEEEDGATGESWQVGGVPGCSQAGRHRVQGISHIVSASCQSAVCYSFLDDK